MPTLYFDTSALVKLYVDETGSDWVRQIYHRPAFQIAFSHIGMVEAASALARRRRMQEISEAQQKRLFKKLLFDVQQRFTIQAVTDDILRIAAHLTQQHPLRGYDAVHLATALELNRVLTANRLPAVTFVSADDKLNAAARSEGLAVIKPENQGEG